MLLPLSGMGDGFEAIAEAIFASRGRRLEHVPVGIFRAPQKAPRGDSSRSSPHLAMHFPAEGLRDRGFDACPSLLDPALFIGPFHGERSVAVVAVAKSYHNQSWTHTHTLI